MVLILTEDEDLDSIIFVALNGWLGSQQHPKQMLNKQDLFSKSYRLKVMYKIKPKQ